MSEKIKLIWDFRGPNARQTALHHEIHLKEYVDIEKLTEKTAGTEHINDMFSIAFLVVTKAEMKFVRDALKPHRGELYTNNS